MTQRNSSNMILLPLVAGMAGAFTALLLAPRSGRETRRQLQLAAGDLKQEAEDTLDHAQSNAHEALERAKKLKSRLGEAFHKSDDQANAKTDDSPLITSWKEEI